MEDVQQPWTGQPASEAEMDEAFRNYMDTVLQMNRVCGVVGQLAQVMVLPCANHGIT